MPRAKHRSGEQQPHSRRPRGVSQSPTSLVVYVAGIDVKANAHYPGRFCGFAMCYCRREGPDGSTEVSRPHSRPLE